MCENWGKVVKYAIEKVEVKFRPLYLLLAGFI